MVSLSSKKMRFLSVLFLFFSFFYFAGCEKIPFLNFKKPTPQKAAKELTPPKVQGTVIAKVNNLPLTLEDLNEEVQAVNADLADRPELQIITREQRINYLKDEMVRRALIYQEALDRGLDRKEEVINALEKTKIQLLVMELLREEVDKIDVSSKDIEEYYKSNVDQFRQPEERQLREIAVPTEQEAKEIMIQLLQGQDFAALAKDKSKSDTAKNGGDLGFISRGKKFGQFDEIAFSDTLETGKTSSIFKGPDGYYIIKLETKRGGAQRSLSDSWEDIKQGLSFLKKAGKINDLIAKLSKDAKIEIYEGEIK